MGSYKDFVWWAVTQSTLQPTVKMKEEVGHLHGMYHIWQARQSFQSEYIRVSIMCREYFHQQVWCNIAKTHCNRHLTMSISGCSWDHYWTLSTQSHYHYGLVNNDKTVQAYVPSHFVPVLHAPDMWWPQQTQRGQLVEGLQMVALLMWAQPLQFHHQETNERNEAMKIP